MIYLITYESGVQVYAATGAMLIDTVLSDAQWIVDVHKVHATMEDHLGSDIPQPEETIEEILNGHEGVTGVWFSPTISAPRTSLPAPRLNTEKRTGDYQGQPKGTLHFSSCCGTEGFHRSSKDGRCKACR